MSMYDDYDFSVIPAKKSGDGPIPVIPAYAGGSMTAQRSFKVPCVNVQEFAFRMLGRYFEPVNYEDPVLPIEFPWDDVAYTQMARMVAIGYSVTPLCENCFNAWFGEDESGPRESLQFPQNYEYLESYYISPRDGEEYSADPAECDCIVKIDYATPPWTCTWSDLGDAILENTAIKVTRKPSYELFTVPTRALVWHALPDGPDKQLKGDSNATILIPKADITIDWFNVPVRFMCQVESHLNQFRGTVNNAAFGNFLDCESYSTGSGSAYTCNQSEAETLQFIDWEEIDQYRTSSFRFMDSTAVRIHLKQKRIVDPVDDEVKGWNHLFLDRSRGDSPTGRWERVKQQGVGGNYDLFPLKNWATLLKPTFT